MPAAKPIPAQGTTFEWPDDTPTTPVMLEVGGIQSYSGFDGERGEEDVTTMASTAMEFRQQLIDNGNLTLNLLYDPRDDGQAQMISDYAEGVEKEAVLTLSTGHTLTFVGWVKQFPIDAAANESLKTAVVIRITGDVTLADPA